MHFQPQTKSAQFPSQFEDIYMANFVVHFTMLFSCFLLLAISCTAKKICGHQNGYKKVRASQEMHSGMRNDHQGTTAQEITTQKI